MCVQELLLGIEEAALVPPFPLGGISCQREVVCGDWLRSGRVVVPLQEIQKLL